MLYFLEGPHRFFRRGVSALVAYTVSEMIGFENQILLGMERVRIHVRRKYLRFNIEQQVVRVASVPHGGMESKASS